MAIDYLEGLGAEHVGDALSEHCRAPSVGQDRGPPPASGIVLAAFDAAHAGSFASSSSLRSALPQAIKSRSSPWRTGCGRDNCKRCACPSLMQIAPRRLGFLSPARRRLVDFAAIVAGLPSDSPVAYWDAGDVVFRGGWTNCGPRCGFVS
ncbi:MAG: hypothetical protein U0836_18165 [Pirellulales bacterium]